jgi:hypothetical protein
LIQFLLLHPSNKADQEGKETVSHKNLSRLSAKIRHPSNSFINPDGMFPPFPDPDGVMSSEAVEQDPSTTAFHTTHGDSLTTPPAYELNEMWDWPLHGYGEAEVGEPMTDFSSWSLLQYLEGDNTAP